MIDEVREWLYWRVVYWDNTHPKPQWLQQVVWRVREFLV